MQRDPTPGRPGEAGWAAIIRELEHRNPDKVYTLRDRDNGPGDQPADADAAGRSTHGAHQ
jgi:hypothetical protein